SPAEVSTLALHDALPISQDKDCPGTVLCYGADLNKIITSEHETYEKGYLSGSLYPGSSPDRRKRPLLSFGAGLFSENGDDHKRRSEEHTSELQSRENLVC